jgi:hypothetical protein
MLNPSGKQDQRTESNMSYETANKINENYSVYTTDAGKGQEHGVIFTPTPAKEDDCIVPQTFPICRLTDDGLKIHPTNATRQTSDSRYAHAVSIALANGAEDQRDYDEDMAIEAAAEHEVQAAIAKRKQEIIDEAHRIIGEGTWPTTLCINIALPAAALGDEASIDFLRMNRGKIEEATGAAAAAAGGQQS